MQLTLFKPEWMILLGWALLAVGCTPKPEPLPDWVMQQPVVQDYWYGVGIAHTREDARIQAIQEISTQISVEISGSVSRIMTEHNTDLHDYTKSISALRIENELTLLELVDSHFSDNRHYVLLRLSQSDYYARIADQRRSAVAQSRELLKQAESGFGAKSFRLWADAVAQIEPYLDDEMLIENPDGNDRQIRLPVYLQQKLLEFSRRIKLTMADADSQAVSGLPQNLEFRVVCIDRISGTPISGIPLRVDLPNADLANDDISITDENGISGIAVRRLHSGDSPRLLKITVDRSVLLAREDGLQFTDDFPSLTLPIKVRGLRICLKASEENLATQLDSYVITPQLKRWLTETYQASFVKQSYADLLLEVTVSTRKLQDVPEKYYGQLLYQTTADLNIEVRDLLTGNELGQVTVSRRKVVSYQSFPNAGFDGIRKILQKMDHDIFPELKAVIEQR